MLFLGIGISMVVGVVLAIVGMVKIVKGDQRKPPGGVFVLIGLALQLWWLALFVYAAYKFSPPQ